MKLVITLIMFLTSCASFGISIVPELSQRTLRIDPNAAGFIYQYERCLKKFLGICTKKGMQVDKYDLTRPDVRKQLIDMGFVAKVREVPK